MYVSYKNAIQWIADNDDTEFLDDPDVDTISVTCSFVMDMFDKTEEQVKADLRKALERNQS